MSKNNEQSLEVIRHSFAHVLMHALKRLYGAVPGVGPAVENGFYHDFDTEHQVEEAELPKIEKEMRKIIKEDHPIERKVMKMEEGIACLKELGYEYTVEMAEELKEQEEGEITFYEQGDFINMCRGPHVESTGKLEPDAFKLTKLAGVYWRSDENNKMIQRITGAAFRNKKELDEYLAMVEEAKKRDHRKLGRELDLFCFSDLVGPGLPMFTPKGTVIKEELQRKVEKTCAEYGFKKVITPHLAKIDLYKISGHADKFAEELFHVTSRHKQEYVMKPVQCPHQAQIYASRPRSYRDLPIRYMESEKQYRAEKPGEIGGLSRVIAITCEDGHSFCRVEQVKQEVMNMVNIIKDFYTALGLWGNHWVSLSVRDYDHPEKYIGEPGDWDKCEQMLEEISNEMGLEAKRCEGEAALYGPKLDFMFRDALGKEIQIPTVQLDFSTAKKFGLVFTNESGQEEHPVMVHRAILGSYERFFVLLIEHFAGAFPVWLSPVHAKILSVGEAHREFCRQLSEEFRQEGIRSEVDESDETVGNKIRKATQEKPPYVLVVGDKEAGSDMLSVRDRDTGKTRSISKQDFIQEVKEQMA